MVPPFDFYRIALVDMFVGSTEESIVPNTLGDTAKLFGRTIVDSGTTLLILANEVPALKSTIHLFIRLFIRSMQFIVDLRPIGLHQQVYANMFVYFQLHFSHLPHISGSNTFFDPGRCFVVPDPSVYPTIYFRFRRSESSPNDVVDLALPPWSYLMNGTNALGMPCRFLGIVPNEGDNSYVGTILGDVFMQAFNIAFDRANKKFGIAPILDCSSMITIHYPRARITRVCCANSYLWSLLSSFLPLSLLFSPSVFARG